MTLLRLFVRQDLSQRYAGNVLGLAWAGLAPLLQLALFALVFVHIFKARVPGLDGAGYVAFLALGMWPWFAFSEAVGRANTAIVEQAGLLDKVAVPIAVLAAARVITPFLVHGAGFLLVLIALPLLGIPLHWQFLPLSLLPWTLLLVLALSIGMMAALTQVFVRDLGQFLGHLLAAWMFLSPILYPRELAPRSLQWWYSMNPISGIVEAIRDPLLFGTLPTNTILYAVLGAALLGVLAYAMYARLRPHVEDFL